MSPSITTEYEIKIYILMTLESSSEMGAFLESK